MIDERSRRRVLTVLVVSLLLVLVYWLLWFAARDAIASNNTAPYYQFENAFPLADGWLAVCLLGAWLTLRKHQPSALFWLLTGAGAGVYLFCMDALYDLEHAIWWRSGVGGYIELAINLITLAVSIGLLRWSWQNRAALLAGDTR